MIGIDLQTVVVQVDGTILVANLSVPTDARGLVIFSNGCCNCRLGPRSRFLAEALNRQGMATLLADLLTEDEDDYYHNRFDIGTLTKRLLGMTTWAMEHPQLHDLDMGYFGDATGTAAAICAAVRLKWHIKAIVSKGGRPDLAGTALQQLKAPTLLIVGARDGLVHDLNLEAFRQLNCPKKLEILEGASYLLKSPEQLFETAKLAGDWFAENLVANCELRTANCEL